jgi:O-antigen/teichoic acid export membrane protein
VTQTGAVVARLPVGRALASGFVQSVARTFATRVLVLVVGMMTSVLVARVLGPAGRGSYFLAVTVAALVTQLGNFGMHASNTYYVSRDRSLLPALLGNSLAAGTGFLALVVTIASVVAWFAPATLPVREALAWMLVPSIGLGLVYLLLQNLLIGIGDVRRYNRIELGQALLTVVLMGAVVAIGRDTPTSLLAAATTATFGAAIAAYRRLRKHCSVRPWISPSLLTRALGYGSRAYLAALASYLVLRLDVILIGYMLPAEQTGYYSISATLADKLQVLPVVIGTLLFPRLSAMTAAEEQWFAARRVARATFVVMVVLAGTVAALAHPLVEMLYGPRFLPALPSFYILLPGVVLLSTNMVFMNYFASRGMPPVTVIATAGAAALNVGLNLALVPSMGIAGAAVSSTVAYGVMVLCSLVYIALRPITEP